jgi:hypothetical protein
MPFRIEAKIQDGAISVIVDTAREALAKLDEFVEHGYEVIAKDLTGRIVQAGALFDDPAEE